MCSLLRTVSTPLLCLALAGCGGDDGGNKPAAGSNLPPQAAPNITAQPANQTAILGQTATFTVAVTGPPAPTITWQRSTNGSTWTTITGATGTTHSLATQKSDDSALFRPALTARPQPQPKTVKFPYTIGQQGRFHDIVTFSLDSNVVFPLHRK